MAIYKERIEEALALLEKVRIKRDDKVYKFTNKKTNKGGKFSNVRRLSIVKTNIEDHDLDMNVNNKKVEVYYCEELDVRHREKEYLKALSRIYNEFKMIP